MNSRGARGERQGNIASSPCTLTKRFFRESLEFPCADEIGREINAVYLASDLSEAWSAD